jgi:integrase
MFAVSRFENRNGVTSWRVSGFLHGVRIRRNFKTREEAAAENAALELRALQATNGLRPAATFLADEQLREAEAAFRRLSDRPHSLLYYLDYALATHREPDQLKPLAEAVAEYVAFKTQEQKRTLISPRQLRSIQNELETLKKRFPRSPVSQFTPATLTDFFERGGPSLKTSNNRRGLLSTFFKFALQRDWIVSNPVEKTMHHRIAHRRGSADTLSAEQAMELMAHVESYQDGRLVPFFALCLFAGIRPCLRSGEILKIKAKDIRLDIGVIHIEPEVAKTREKRMVTIQPNLAAWLRAYPVDRFPIVPVNLEFTRRTVAKKFDLTHDVLRHTFISMFVAKFRSLGEGALQAGNSETIIRKHYLNLKSTAEADQFWGILPQGKAAETVVTPFVTAPAQHGAAQAKPAA